MGAFEPTIAPRDPDARGLSVEQVAALLESATQTIVGELRAMGDEVARWRPAPGEWCANEVVGHIIEADRRGYSGRIGRILAAAPGVEPFEPAWDQPSVAAARDDCAKPAELIIAELLASRGPAMALVRSLKPADMGRAAVHQNVGRVTVGELLREWCFHDRNHVRQLLTVVQARAWPVMGNTRRFADPDA